MEREDVMGVSGRWMSLVFLVFSVVETQAQCTDQELDLLATCIMPYNLKIFHAIGTGPSCDRSRISNDICTDFATIVNCVNQQPLSKTTCRPYAVGQINPNLQISCKINDFEDVCKNAPAIDKGSSPSASTSPTTSTLSSTSVTSVATGGGETASGHTWLTLMHFTTALLATLM